MTQRRKYGNTKTEREGYVFDSGTEAMRYTELRLRESANEISNLTVQPRFNLSLNGVKLGFYKADFSYIEHCKTVVEDVKALSCRNGKWVRPTCTPIYRLKKKLVEAIYGIVVQEYPPIPDYKSRSGREAG